MYNQDNSNWELVDLIFQLGKEKMIRIAKNYDLRFSKPDMMINEDNLRQEFTLPSNWRITNSERGYIMNIPNDIAMYASIANKALERAISKYQEMHDRGVTYLILSDEQSSEFYDYFEEIIQAIIISYTTIECMANTCIPYHYEYVIEKTGKKEVYNKDGIERFFSLKDKLKLIIPEAIGVPSPVNETWWQHLIELEKSRNEIIHSKDAKAEERYSFFVNERVFDIINCHNEIVTFYATQLCYLKSPIMNDFPVGSGCDEIIPSIITQRSFNSLYNSFYNPSKPLPED